MSAKLIVLGSSSHGNGYIIHTDKESLVLEAGVPFKSVLKAERYFLPNIKGALVSHAHQDHAKYIKQFQIYFVPVYSNEEVSGKYAGVKMLKHMKNYEIGGFKVMPLEVPHNCKNFAYIIDHEEFGRLVFATDLQSFPYRIKGVNHFLIEANYDENLIVDAMMDSAEIRSHSEFHMEIDNTLKALRNSGRNAQNVILVHLSDNYSNTEDFKRRVKEEFVADVYVADKGMEIDISKYDF